MSFAEQLHQEQASVLKELERRVSCHWQNTVIAEIKKQCLEAAKSQQTVCHFTFRCDDPRCAAGGATVRVMNSVGLRMLLSQNSSKIDSRISQTNWACTVPSAVLIVDFVVYHSFKSRRRSPGGAWSRPLSNPHPSPTPTPRSSTEQRWQALCHQKGTRRVTQSTSKRSAPRSRPPWRRLESKARGARGSAAFSKRSGTSGILTAMLRQTRHWQRQC